MKSKWGWIKLKAQFWNGVTFLHLQLKFKELEQFQLRITFLSRVATMSAKGVKLEKNSFIHSWTATAKQRYTYRPVTGNNRQGNVAVNKFKT